jgi:hypothetical protein
MPSSFPVFIAFMVYIAITVVALVVFAPMLLFKSTRLLAKKILATVLISFPCLIVMGLFISLIFLIPALIFGWLANGGYLPRKPVMILGIIGLFVFAGLIIVCSLYLWIIASKLIYLRLEKKTTSAFLDNDIGFKLLRPYLIKLKLYSSQTI